MLVKDITQGLAHNPRSTNAINLIINHPKDRAEDLLCNRNLIRFLTVKAEPGKRGCKSVSATLCCSNKRFQGLRGLQTEVKFIHPYTSCVSSVGSCQAPRSTVVSGLQYSLWLGNCHPKAEGKETA
jgi:hypothetical protein